MNARPIQTLVIEPRAEARLILRTILSSISEVHARYASDLQDATELDGVDLLVIAGTVPGAGDLAARAARKKSLVVFLSREGDTERLESAGGWTLSLPCPFLRVKSFFQIVTRALREGRRPTTTTAKPAMAWAS